MKGDSLVKVVMALLRVFCGVLTGFFGCLAVAVAAYLPLERNFSFSNGPGITVMVILVVGIALLWVSSKFFHGLFARQQTS